MAYVPPQARATERYPGEMIVPDLLNRIGAFLSRQRGGSRMSTFGGTDFTTLPGGSNYKPGMRPGDIDRRKIGEELNPSPLASPAFDNTLEGQYQRYFKTPEFDYVFGAGARGEGAPKDAAAMEFLGNQIKAPKKDTNIASMYAAQSAMGRVNQDKIQEYFADADLPGNVKKENEEQTALQKWAEKNPMLAQRLYQKQQKKIQDAIPDNPAFDTGTAVRGETPGSFEQQMQYGAGSPISKSPTEYDISNRDEDDLNRRMRELGL